MFALCGIAVCRLLLCCKSNTNTTNIPQAVTEECRMWDNGLALPIVPKALVLGKPQDTNGDGLTDRAEASHNTLKLIASWAISECYVAASILN